MGYSPKLYDQRLKLDAIRGCVPEELKGFIKFWHVYMEFLQKRSGF